MAVGLNFGNSSLNDFDTPNSTLSMTSNSQAQANLTTQTASEENYSNDYSGNHFLVLVVVGILDGTIVVVMVLTMVVVVV